MANSDTSLPRIGLALVILVMAAGLVTIAVPRLQASLHFLPVDAAIQRYFDSGEIPGAQLDALERRADEAMQRAAHYRYADGLSFINYLQALDAADKPWLQRPALHRSMTSGLEAVRRAPAEPRTWLRIARASAVLDRERTAVVTALEMSILTGRVEPELLLPRLELGYRYLPLLDEDSVALLRDQTLLTWRVNPRALHRALDAGTLDPDRVRSVLGEAGADFFAERNGKA